MTTFTHQSRVGRLSLCGLAIVLVSASAAAAQSDPNAALSFHGPVYQPVSPNPVEMGFTQHHSSTAFEGAQRGRAAIIQAMGNYQLDASQAAILRQQARAMDRENDLKQTQALHAQKEMWNKARIEVREQREARMAEGQMKIAQRRATVYREVYRLSSNEFDAKTGAITWPSAMQNATYQQVRNRVDELFRVQFGYGDPQPGTAREIVRNIE
ncbi:MAG TPA: hypothetical protein VFW73_07020, partial [Lacipirellulaceae bacterium]|nr:hypothetical protein [Lacipirellulaceae bacterium]